MKFSKFKFSPLYYITSFIVFSTIFLLPYSATAQSSSSILVDVAPPNPAPFQDVSINLSSYANNLDSVLISWSVDGKSALSGIGKKSFLVKAPAAGREITVVATVSLPEGTLEKRLVIRPAVMTLLWQADDSYTPPFYRGKAMPSPDSEVKVVAIPEIKNSAGGMINPKNMTYVWKKDYTNNQEGSGYGKNFFTYTNDFLENINNIDVTATTIDGENSSEASIDIGTTDPEIVFYKNDSTLGTLWEQALADSHRVQGSEVVIATPYFLSPKQILNPVLTFNWFINDTPMIITRFRKNAIPLKVPEGVSGISKLRLEIENQEKIFQNISKEINVEF